MKIPGTVILFNPTISDVILNIQSYIESLDVLYVFDNSDYVVNHKKELEDNFSKVKFYTFADNKGIAFALNFCAEIAYKSGYEWLLTMDQDSSFLLPDGFNTYLKAIQNELCNNSIAYFSPLYPNEASKSEQFYTSGSLMNLQVWRNIGKFDEKLFIDEVDGDFTYRLSEANYELKKIHNSSLNHTLGEKCSKKFLGKIFQSDNHTALRKYYIARNRVYLMKKRPSMRVLYFSDSFRKLVMFAIVESDRRNKIFMILKGIYDGLLNHMGKYNKA